MRAQALAGLFLASTPVLSQSLIDALTENGASRFAAFIQSDPDVLASYKSGQIKTVFAPSDLLSPPIALAQRDLSPDDVQQAQLQGAQELTSLGTASGTLPGAIITTSADSPGLGGQGQVVVTDTRPENVTHPTKRWGSSPVARRQSSLPGQSLLRISSGLGIISNVVKGDIPFDGGLIHITDSYFTRPATLSSTAQSLGQTTFFNLASSSNLTTTLENTQFLTVFLPSNAAFSAANVASFTSASLISNHVVAGYAGYLPQLQDGTVLTTQKGETLVISIRSGIYYVNGAKITTANIITENGVVHIIDQVLLPNSTPPPVSSDGVLSKTISLVCVIGAVAGVVMAQL